MKNFAPPFFNHFSLSLKKKQKKRVLMRAMTKKVNILFTFQLPIYYILDQEILIGANVDMLFVSGAAKQNEYAGEI